MHETINGKAQLSTDGTTWVQVYGTSSLTVRPGTAPVKMRRTVGGVKNISGRPGPETIQLTIRRMLVSHQSYGMLCDAHEGPDKIMLRFSVPQRLIATSKLNASVTIDGSAGTVAFGSLGQHVDFTSPDVYQGLTIKAPNGLLWSIREIRSAQDISVQMNQQNYNGTYSVVVPSVKLGPVQCALTSFKRLDADAGGVFGTAAAFTPSSPIGRLTIGNFT